MHYSAKGTLAIKQPVFEKIEMQLQGGIAVNSNRINLVEAQLVLAYDYNGIKLEPGDKVILRGDAGLQPWAKAKMILGAMEFVLCPESQMVGFANSR